LEFRGSTRIGRHVQLGGQAGLAGHLKVGDGAVVGAQAGVTKDVPPKSFVSGYPAMDHRKASRMHAHMMRLPDLKARVKELEAQLNALRNEVDE
jgi:UDP-3-O-[3-hydroxymyristoyl] glucosamine N-acyltransferase